MMACRGGGFKLEAGEGSLRVWLVEVMCYMIRGSCVKCLCSRMSARLVGWCVHLGEWAAEACKSICRFKIFLISFSRMSDFL
jgi:hypothetical protein